MGRVDAHTALGTGASGHHFQIGGPTDHVAGGAFGHVWRVPEHVAFAFAVIEVSPRAAQPFFKQGASHHAAGDDESRGVELDHFHVAHLRARPIEHRNAVGGFLGSRGMETILGRSAAGGHQRSRRFHDDEARVAHVVEQRSGDGLAFGVQQKFHSARFFQNGNLPLEYLFGRAADDLDTRQVSLVDGAVEALPGKGLLVDVPVRTPVEETAADGFQFLDRGVACSTSCRARS